MDYYCKRSDNQTTIEKLQEAVRLTLPDYEECLKKDFPFTEQEIMNLMSLANAYAHAGDVDEAVYILRDCYNACKRIIFLERMQII